jgi:cation diffusion facilitator CzcD-associated flavoprotein CzcO
VLISEHNFFWVERLPKMRVAIIGGGPGGLVTLKYLLEASQRFNVAPIEAKLFEAQDGIGGTFRYRTYPEGEVSLDSLTAMVIDSTNSPYRWSRQNS